MSFDERDSRSHLFEEACSGFPLLIIPGGGVNATISGLSGPTSPFNPIEAYEGEPRHRRRPLQRQCWSVRRSARGRSPMGARTDGRNGLMDHVANDLFVATAARAVRLRGSKDNSASGTGLPNK